MSETVGNAVRARVVTVHLVIAEQNASDPNDTQPILATAAEIADGVGEMLREATAAGFLLDWGYANGANPDVAKVIESDDYEEGDFYGLAGLDRI